MVSSLSSRLLKAEAKAKIATSIVTKANTHTSGYSADRSDQESPPASSLCTEEEKNKDMRAQHVERCAKRRRTEEANFQAFNARNELIKAGVECLPGLYGRSRALPRGSIDMDSVDLIVISKTKNKNNNNHKSDQDGNATDPVMEQECHHFSSDEYSELLLCSQQFYLTSGRIPTPSEDALNERASQTSSSNTTGNSTNADSDNECELDIPPIAQDSGSSDETPPITVDSIPYIQASLDSSVELTLSDAIVHFDSARLIVEQKLHLRIVCANSAFSRLTGVSSEDVIGRSLTEILEYVPATKKLKKKTLVKLRFSCDGGITQDVYSLVTFPVKNKESDLTTHLVLELSDSHTDTSRVSNESTLRQMQTAAKAFNAVG